MNELVRLVTVLLAGGLVLAAFFVVLSVLFPERVGRARALAARAPGRAFVVGLINGGFLTVLVVVLLALTEWTGLQLFGLPALILIVVAAVAALLGLGGVVQLVGERLLPERTPAVRQAIGAVVLGLACSAPVVGWFGLLPYVTLLGLGAFILSFFEVGSRPGPE